MDDLFKGRHFDREIIAGSSPRRIQTVEPPHKSPPQTLPAALPNQSPEKVSPKSGRVLLSHAAA
jgi:hypothetical protein